MVAAGTLLSAFWILAANSWMQYPAGHEVRDGIAYPVDWIQVIFSPTFPWRFAHMVVAAYLTTSVVVLAVGARYLLADKFHDEARIMIGMGLGLALVLAPAQLVVEVRRELDTGGIQPANRTIEAPGRPGSRYLCCSRSPTRPKAATITNSASRSWAATSLLAIGTDFTRGSTILRPPIGRHFGRHSSLFGLWLR